MKLKNVKTKACKATPDEPHDFVERGKWMEKKLKTHHQMQCSKCKYWHIWKKR